MPWIIGRAVAVLIPETDKNLIQGVGARHAQMLRILRVAPLPRPAPLYQNPVRLLTGSATAAPKDQANHKQPLRPFHTIQKGVIKRNLDKVWFHQEPSLGLFLLESHGCFMIVWSCGGMAGFY